MHLKSMAWAVAAIALAAPAAFAADDEEDKGPTAKEVIERATDADWRPLDPENTLYMYLPAGTVVIELRPDFAPAHVARIKELTREGFYDGLTFHRVIEGFMAQGGDPKGDGTGGSDKPNLKAEFTRHTSDVEGFKEIGRDRIAPRIGYIDGMPVAAQPEGLKTFLTDGHADLWGVHCPGVMSMARATPPDSANSQFFLMIGDARLNLDQRYTTWGWIVDGYEATRRIVRGEPPSRPTPIIRMRVAADIPASDREDIKVMKTDEKIFMDYLKATGDVSDDGYVKDICEIKVPVKVDGKIER
ncbi:peptidylprolyl isomerase [Hyphococcus luteus]|uniref:peptidylprolyl isomerase n=1 Tax=Hyphococcus luteus TaxID=2058213 RepID=A0A2S7K2Z2_9PROT|nr:peptidylprolyl isomerase [Marinicaulis flavus]PQA86818.1 peptidylprolyl isomerase [Marinicaulis flavus]